MPNSHALKTGIPVAVVLSLSLALCGFAIAGNTIPTSVVMQTVPIDVVWVADGVNTYRMDVRLDASTYPEQVSGFDWRFGFPDYIGFDSAAFPPAEDFFFGNLPLNSISDPAWQVTSTSVSGTVGIAGGQVPNAPVGAIGIIGSYWFSVDPSATTGQHTFSVSQSDVTIYDPSGTLCPPFPICSGFIGSIGNFRFEIVAASPADITGPRNVPDGCVDGTDLAVLLGAWCSRAGDADPPGDPGDPPCEGCPMGFELADIAGAGFGPPDGCVDGNDLAMLLGAWCSVAGGNPCGTCS